MFVTPILVIMLKLLNDEGIIKLWKSPVKLKAEDDTAEKTDEPDGKEEKASKKKAKIFGKKK